MNKLKQFSVTLYHGGTNTNFVSTFRGKDTSDAIQRAELFYSGRYPVIGAYEIA
jgi:hypothetical protein